MVALWSFSGPEGAVGGRSRGTILANREFVTTQERARYLERVGKAKRLQQPETPAPAAEPEPEPESEPEAVPEFSRLNITEILARVDHGEVSADEVLEAELQRPEQERRSSLVGKLQQRIEAGE